MKKIKGGKMHEKKIQESEHEFFQFDLPMQKL